MGHDSSNKQKLLIDSEIVYTVPCGLIQTTDISFPRNREGLWKPLKTFWKSTMGVQSPSTHASDVYGPLLTHEYRMVIYKGV